MKYPSDVSDSEWEVIEHHFDSGNYGNRKKYSKRELVNAVFYIIKTGCQWRMLPKDFPPYSTVHSFYRRCRLKGIWERIMNELVKACRMKTGRNENPSYSIIDSQSVKTTSAAEKRGIDGGKKNKRT
ncbi:transposase [bacterium]|nr:MAG: transposase [bacterium]QQR61931.1 MAG: transposase [bacterium]QQR62478.1 MAG: transposase [bacterium]